jgi:citrate lyase subunit beta/citryl-CoA lyase
MNGKGNCSGTAGRRGDRVRSDLWVSIDRGDSGALEVDISSRVMSYYGEAIRAQVGDTAKDFGITSGRIVIDDQGALPFVIAARLEAAALSAGCQPQGDVRPTVTVPPATPSERNRLRRSRLYLPGNEPKYFINATLYQPDGIILDLEDSVPHAAKDAARILVRNALRCVDFHSVERMVRINQLPLGLNDLKTIVPERPELILLPKVERAEDIKAVADVIDDLIGADQPLWLMPILETGLGIENAYAIASASPRVAALTIGLEDYAADIGVPRSSSGNESVYARGRLVNAARAAGVQAIDSVYGQVDDMAGLKAWGQRSRDLGFQGMGCLHPRQIDVIHGAFNPDAAQIERALAIVDAFEKAEAAGLGVVSLGSKMIDPPVVKQAMRLVKQARALCLPPFDSTDNKTQKDQG